MASLDAHEITVSIQATKNPKSKLISHEHGSLEDGWDVPSQLWIHLYHDLLLAALSTASNPTVPVSNAVKYYRFVEYFEQHADRYGDGQLVASISKQDFLLKLDDLVPAKMLKIKDRLPHATKEESVKIVRKITITPDMLAEYKQMGGGQELEENIMDHEKQLTLQDFLNNVLQKEHPWLYTTTMDQSKSHKEGGEVSESPRVDRRRRARELHTRLVTELGTLPF
jgi:hypothetical protein